MQNPIDDEVLSAFLDGELPPKEMERVATLLAERPDLNAKVLHHEKLRSNLRQAFAEIVSASVPDRLRQAAQSAPISWRWRLKRFLAFPSIKFLVPAGATLAAGLVIGFLLQPTNDLTFNNGALMASGTLATALDDKLASSGYDGTGPRIGISFRNRDGRDCRTFTNGNLAGLACHQQNGWTIGTLVHQPSEQSGTYRMAGSEMPDAIRQAVTASIAGEPFDAAAEKAAREIGWK
jgi:hypothetical protein